ncbi:MAG TPA: CHASE domain-containing protein [Holophagaceae bacterium]|nr:CHASE domain-containing protein [Holophagaceae bacterium]
MALRLPWFIPNPAKLPLRERPLLAALAILAVGLGLTLSIASAGQRNARERIQQRMDRQVERTDLSMQAHLVTYEGLLRGAKGLFQVQPQVTAEDWRRFVAELDLPGRYPSVKGLAFIEAKDAGHFPIRFSEPAEANPRAVGYDIALDPEQRKAADRAAASGERALTAPIYFHDAGQERSAFALLLPVYKGEPAPTPEARRAALVGWVSAAVYLDKMMDEVMQGMDPDLGTQILGGYHPIRKALAYEANMGGLEGRISDFGTHTQPRIILFKWGEPNWAGRVVPLPSLESAPDYRWPSWFLLLGSTISALLAGLAWSLVSTRARAVAMADGMTRALQETLNRHERHAAQTPLGLLEWDAEQRIRSWNPAAARLFKRPEAEALGQPVVPLLALDTPDAEAAMLRALDAVRNAETGAEHTLDCRTKEGDALICRWYTSPLLDGKGIFLGATALVEDLTEARKSEEALRLGQKLESLGLLAGGISHDFNNLLAAVQANLDAARQLTDGAAPGVEFLDRARLGTERATELCRQILDYSGQGPLATQPVQLNKVVTEMAELLAASRPPGVTLRFQLAPDLPNVQADPVQMQQVVLNLVTNATEAIGEAEGAVAISTSHRVYSDLELEQGYPGQGLLPGPYVSLRVKDSGCGMDEAVLARIFDPFFTTKFSGRGMGLATVQGIVKAHRGGLRVNSKPGAGSTFVAILPASPAPRPSMEIPEDEPGFGVVLVADDEEPVRTVMALTLSKAGFEVLAARDGSEALKLFEENQDLLRCALLDKVMPGLDGMAVMRAIRAARPDLPVILCSGFTESGAVPAREAGGPDGFLRKPFRTQDMLKALRRALREAEARGLGAGA